MGPTWGAKGRAHGPGIPAVDMGGVSEALQRHRGFLVKTLGQTQRHGRAWASRRPGWREWQGQLEGTEKTPKRLPGNALSGRKGTGLSPPQPGDKAHPRGREQSGRTREKRNFLGDKHRVRTQGRTDTAGHTLQGLAFKRGPQNTPCLDCTITPRT